MAVIGFLKTNLNPKPFGKNCHCLHIKRTSILSIMGLIEQAYLGLGHRGQAEEEEAPSPQREWRDRPMDREGRPQSPGQPIPPD